MSSAPQSPAFSTGRVERRVFGPDSAQAIAYIYILRNRRGEEVAITNYGATIVFVRMPDRNGQLGDVVLGYDALTDYIGGRAYLGATVGRYANRIAEARFRLNGTEYRLSRNEDGQHLHGGFRGLSQVWWTAWPLAGNSDPSLRLHCLSRDGQEGYPGNLTVYVTFSLNDDRELTIEYQARSDQDTIINLTNHSYFNLRGLGDILDHEIMLAGDFFTPVDANLIPTGEIRAVEGTPFDFRRPASVGARIHRDNDQLLFAGGYDHNWVLGPPGGNALRHAADVYEPVSGRHLAVWTTEPGIQFYSGNGLDEPAGKHGTHHRRRHGLCLETQHFPDSPNHPSFPSTVLQAGSTFSSTTIYKFSTS
jgi:aldose 1-epimerase